MQMMDLLRMSLARLATRATMQALRSPLAQGLSLACVFLVLSVAFLLQMHHTAKEASRETVREEMLHIAKLAASRVDAARHARVRTTGSQNDADYRAIVTELRALRDAAEGVRYVYTVSSSPEGPRFMIDAAEPVDDDGDGVIDQAGLRELYEGSDHDMMEALATSTPQVTPEPATDKWGTWISAYAPVVDAQGGLECIVGVDMSAQAFSERLSRIDTSLRATLAVALVSSGVLGVAVFGMQRRRRAAAAALAASESRFRQLFEAMPVLVWLTDPEGRCTGANREWLTLTGTTPTANLGLGWQRSVHPDDLPGLADAAADASSRRCTWEREFRLRDANGGHRWVAARGVPMHDEAGRFVGYIGGCMDVTARRDSETQLACLLTMTTALAQASDLDAAARAVIRSIEGCTGCARAAILLHDAEGVCRFVGWKGLSASYRAEVEGHCPWAKGSHGATSIRVGDVQADPLTRAYGELMARERVRSLAFIPISNDTGVIGKLMLYGNETGSVTPAHVASAEAVASAVAAAIGRIHSRQALLQSEQRLRRVIDTAMDPLVRLDERGIISDWNRQAERVFAIPREDALGRALDSLVLAPECREAFRGMLRELLSGPAERGARVELDGESRDGRAMKVEIAASLMRCDGRVEYNTFVRDVTETKAASARLLDAMHAAEAASKAKSDFLANMSHEIRTPMTAIIGFADLLADGTESSLSAEQRREALETIRRNGEHLLTIINDILDVSKIEAGKVTIERVPTDPRTLVDEVVSLMQVRASGKGIGVVHIREGDMPRGILTDPLRLRQIVVNLVGNAIKFTDRGSVRIITRAAPDRPDTLCIEVHDTGIGIPPERLGRLFSAFTQADSTVTRRFGGTGLGLHLSRLLARLLGGDITVSSSPGVGSVFCATVHAPPATMPAAAAPESKPPATHLGGLRILVAEDGPDNRRLIQHVLKKAGASVTLVENGQEALEAVMRTRTQPFDLILMDMQMPVLDGYTATQEIRRAGDTTPIIALTAHAMTGDRDRCIAAGCTDYETKPLSVPRLLATCARNAARARGADNPPAAAA
ncbi:MAG: PAS domain S-box protein [Leptolyngbya sp. PLA1]|nr:PAS domain S-box protein [Leptolyngbya sp. PLA1]